jgi:hypothetical protein
MSATIDDDDMARAVAFIDGAMSADERLRFELRLAAEPELASALESLMRTDELVRRASARRASGGEVISLAARKKRSAWPWIASLAAAVLAAFGIVRWLEHEHPSRAERIASLAPSFASPEAFLASRPELEGLTPPGLGSLRGASEETNIGAAEFVAKAHALEEKPASSHAARAPITAGWFVIPIELDARSSVVVLGFPRNGSNARLYPEAADARVPGERGRLDAGVHTLPRERIELAANSGATPSVAYNRGFLVPIGARELDVVVGVRREELDGELLATIDDALKRGETRASLRTLLEQRGFGVTELAVIEPKD